MEQEKTPALNTAAESQSAQEQPAPTQQAPAIDPILGKYDIASEDALKDIIGRAQGYEAVKGDYDKVMAENENLRTELLLRDKGIRKERYDDVRIWFKGAGKKLDEAGMDEAMKTHPEWTAPVDTFGGTRKSEKPGPVEDDKAIAGMFGLDSFVN